MDLFTRQKAARTIQTAIRSHAALEPEPVAVVEESAESEAESEESDGSDAE